MNSTKIGLIIGLMTAALVGIGGLQTYWIRSAIQLNEDQFDKNVLAALNRVADKIQFVENARVMEAIQFSYQKLGTPPPNFQPNAPFLENGFALRQNGRRDSLASQFQNSVSSWE